jgi:zinc transport system permease protein
VPDLLNAFMTQSFLQNAACVAILGSVACGVIGSYVVVKRMSFISGGIAHAVLGGMGVAYFFDAEPLLGAIVSAIIFALVIGWVSLSAQQHEDTIIGAVWAVGMATGLLFIYKKPGYAPELTSYLFGHILLVTRPDVWLIAALDALILALVLVFYKGFLAVCFDEEFARLQGLQVKRLYIALLCLIALTVVILVKVVGIILVIALLTLPAAIAGQWTNGLRKMMFAACALGLVFSLSGLATAYSLNLPGGATIVLITGIGFLVSTGFRALGFTRSRAG